LPDKDSLKIAALLGVANLEARAKRFDLAQAAFARTGLTESECALVDAQPAMKHLGFSGDLFPDEARKWGFHGFVRMEFDIDAAGKPVNSRAVIAYPSFVFIKTSIQGVKRTQYAQSYRPGEALGCTNASMQVRYKP
jgi:outer membrane biosynthesis protein TonB